MLSKGGKRKHMARLKKTLYRVKLSKNNNDMNLENIDLFTHYPASTQSFFFIKKKPLNFISVSYPTLAENIPTGYLPHLLKAKKQSLRLPQQYIIVTEEFKFTDQPFLIAESHGVRFSSKHDPILFVPEINY